MSETLNQFTPDSLEGFEKMEQDLGRDLKFGPDVETLEGLCEDNETLKQLLNDMLDYSYRYVEDVFKMEAMTQKGIVGKDQAQDFAKVDQERTKLHNTMIDSVNIFSRALAREGKDNSWINPIYDGGRATYATFALVTTFRQYLRFRDRNSLEEEGLDDE